MKIKTRYKIAKTKKWLFTFEKGIFNNLINLLFLIILVTLAKIGIIMYNEIINQVAFNAWVWVISMFGIVYAIMNIKLDGLFSIGGGVIMISLLFPHNLWIMHIGSWIISIGLTYYIMDSIISKLLSSNDTNTAQKKW